MLLHDAHKIMQTEKKITILTTQKPIVYHNETHTKSPSLPTPQAMRTRDDDVATESTGETHTIKEEGTCNNCTTTNNKSDRAAKLDEKEINGRERLKRHRAEVAGRVWIPEMWGHEDLLKDWIDCSAFDSLLANNSIMSARAALVHEGRRAPSARLRVQNGC